MYIIIFYRHLILRQRTCFIRTDHRDTSQTFHRLQLAYDSVFSGHFLRPEGKHDGDDRTQRLRNSRNSQCYGKQERISYRLSPQNADTEQYPAKHEYQYRQLFPEVIKIHLQRCPLFFRRAEQRCDLSYFCFHSDRSNQELPTPVSNETSRIHHAETIAKRRLAFNSPAVLVHPQAFSCKRAFIHLKAGIFRDASVCRNKISRFQAHQITHRDFRRRDLYKLPVSKHFSFRSRHFLQTVQRLFRLDRLHRS